MTLFEVLLALAVFGVAALALVKTLQLMGEMTLESRVMRAVEQGLESVMDEYGKTPVLQELQEEIPADANGISYLVVIRPLETLRNQEGRVLLGMFMIQATASWMNGGQRMEKQAETVRFANAFMPVSS